MLCSLKNGCQRLTVDSPTRLTPCYRADFGHRICRPAWAHDYLAIAGVLRDVIWGGPIRGWRYASGVPINAVCWRAPAW